MNLFNLNAKRQISAQAAAARLIGARGGGLPAAFQPAGAVYRAMNADSYGVGYDMLSTGYSGQVSGLGTDVERVISAMKNGHPVSAPQGAATGAQLFTADAIVSSGGAQVVKTGVFPWGWVAAGVAGLAVTYVMLKGRR